MKARIKKLIQHLGSWQDLVFMKDLTTIKIGGPARVFYPRGVGELTEAVKLLYNLHEEYRLLGKGSNLLVSNKGIKKGVVIKLEGADFEYVRIKKNNLVEAGGGLSLKKLLSFCKGESLGGLEFLAGIPATVGGAIRNNAGAFGKDILYFVNSLTILRKDGRLVTVGKENIKYSYRHLQLKEGDIIVSSVFRLRKSSPEEISKRLVFNLAYRRRTQELKFASAGCIFKNPSLSLPAGLLIEAAGLKGLRKNAAAVSLRHANFIVNLGGASFKDAFYLIKYIEKQVKNYFGITLDREVEIWN